MPAPSPAATSPCCDSSSIGYRYRLACGDMSATQTDDLPTLCSDPSDGSVGCGGARRGALRTVPCDQQRRPEADQAGTTPDPIPGATERTSLSEPCVPSNDVACDALRRGQIRRDDVTNRSSRAQADKMISNLPIPRQATSQRLSDLSAPGLSTPLTKLATAHQITGGLQEKDPHLRAFCEWS